MRRLLLSIAFAALAWPAALASASTPTTWRPTGRLLVSVRLPKGPGAHAAAAELRAVAARAGAVEVAPPVPQIGLLVVRAPAGVAPHVLARRLRREPGVRQVAVEGRATLRDAPDDPALTTPETAPGTPAGVPVEWWPAREGFPVAWNITTGVGARVGVIDTGVDGLHPDLAGKLARVVAFDNIPGDGAADYDPSGHGTHVASLACGATGNGIGIAGAGHDCRLIIEKSDLSDSSVARSIVDATDAGAQAINMSFGTDGRTVAPGAIQDALNYAAAHRVVLVAAAADDPVQEQGDPANYLQPTNTGPQLDGGRGLTVTAATYADRRASYAGLGTQISIAAYGAFDEQTGPRGLLGAFPSNTTALETGDASQGIPPCGCRTTFGGDPRYAYLQGTSMAAPQVAAVGALIRNLNPDLSLARVLRIMKLTARRPPGASWTPDLGWGILDAGAALSAARDADARPPTATIRVVRTTRAGHVTLHLQGADTGPPGVYVSGLRKFRIFRSTDGRPRVKIAVTARDTLRLAVRHGSRYAFYVQAVDRAGNASRLPSQPQARTRALGHSL